MNDNISKIKLSSMIVELYYDKIRKMLCAKLDDESEFNDLFNKLKRCVKIENEEYHNLSEKDLRTIFYDLMKNGVNSGIDARIANKIVSEKKLRENYKTKNGFMLSDAITSKVLIDILKRMEKNIERIKNEDILSYEEMYMLEAYNAAHKLNYFSSNNYIEFIALKYSFDINKIPLIYFDEIEEEFGMTFLDESKEVFLKYAKDSVKEIASIKSGDLYYMTYNALFNLSRTEVILEYLDYNNVKKLLNFLDNNYNTDNNEVLGIAKQLIRKRKEELQ